ncbi:MAG: hypothetical protein LBJ58_00990 [Tannerellaceae bacterium]|nr:hypothetical protein [Tannerellaceae bacterium]
MKAQLRMYTVTNPLNIFLCALLIALAGCSNEREVTLNSWVPPSLMISFIDTGGRDLLAGAPVIDKIAYEAQHRGCYLANGECRVRLFVNDEELPAQNMEYSPVNRKSEVGGPYDSVYFLLQALSGTVNDESNRADYTVRCEIIFPYVFGDDDTHVITGELSRENPVGAYRFRRLLSDGAEATPVYMGDNDTLQPNAYIITVNR